ncbi:hypothetical protein L218DRAFT_990439 [Marasmius fiardii PR-910]|nr:hypothetical protein L218DRAFT_990439 [Marasmius fiardii PR-910]
MSSVIPIEIVDHILGFCDHDTISSCSLVCKSWTAISHSRLFERLSIYTLDYGRHLPGMLADVNVERQNCQNLEKKTRALELVRKMDLAFYEQFPNWTLTPDQVQFLTMLMERLKGKISGLKRITIDSRLSDSFAQCSEPRYNLPFSLSSSFAGIVELDVWVKEECLQCLLYFVCSFRNLQFLDLEADVVHLGKFVFGQHDHDAVWTFTLPTSLKTLRFDVLSPSLAEDVVETYRTWLASHPSREISLLLVIGNFASEDFYAPICHNTLATVRYLVPNVALEREYINPIHDLSLFSALETVMFTQLRKEELTAFQVLSLIPILTTITSSHLRKIILIPNPYLPEDVSELEDVTDAWVRLDNTLATPQFSRTILEIRLLNDPVKNPSESTDSVDLACSTSNMYYYEENKELRSLLMQCFTKVHPLFTEFNKERRR